MHRSLLAPPARTCPVIAYIKIGNKLLRHFYLIRSQFEDYNSIKQDTPSPAPIKDSSKLAGVVLLLLVMFFFVVVYNTQSD